MQLNRLKVVVIDSPYDNLENPIVQSLFSQLIALKIEGYRAVYPYGVLPVDAHDFVATHHMVCEEQDGKLRPLMAYKSITLEKCVIHRLPFPGLNVLRSSNAKNHEQALLRMISQWEKSGTTASYGGSWTIAPEVRKDPELKSFLKDIFGGMLVLWEDEIGTKEKVCCGGLRVKTDLFFESMGYQRLEENGVQLPTFEQTSLMGDVAVMLRCTQWSEHALGLAQRFRPMWNARMMFQSQVRHQERKAA